VPIVAVKAIPDGDHTVTAYLTGNGAAAALDYYQHAFGRSRAGCACPMARAGSCTREVRIGGSMVMLADEQAAAAGCGTGWTAVTMVLYVPDVDAVLARALAAGGKARRAVADQFHGDRTGMIEDPFGHLWTIGMHVQDVSAAQMAQRTAAKKG
jgi:PhnB protein